MGLVDHLDQSFERAHRGRQPGKILGIEVELPRVMGNMHVSDPHPEAVERPARDQPGEADAAVGIEIDQVAVGRAVGDADKGGDARQRGRYALLLHGGWTIERLLDDGENAVVARELGWDARAVRIGDR